MRPSVGGAFLVNRKVYLKAGGENEHFYGWGPEDTERVYGINSGFDCGVRDKQNLQALIDTCRMTKAELLKKTGFF